MVTTVTGTVTRTTEKSVALAAGINAMASQAASTSDISSGFGMFRPMERSKMNQIRSTK